MFEDITQMEKEIETFRKNVVASSELVEGIARLTDSTEKQKESFETSTAELIKKIDSSIEQIKADHQSTLHTLSDENNQAISTLQKNLKKEQSVRIEELERIKNELQAIQAEFVERIQQTEKAIEEYQNQFNETRNQISEDHSALLHDLSKQVGTSISNMLKSLSDELDARITVMDQIREAIDSCQAESSKKADRQIEKLSSECERLIGQLKTEIAVQQASYIEQLQHAEQTIKGYQEDAANKYGEFLYRLESTNVDRLFKEVQDLKQSIQTKFFVIVGGIGVAVVLALLGVIVK